MQGLCWWTAGSTVWKRQTLGREKEAGPVVWHQHRRAQGLLPAKGGGRLGWGPACASVSRVDSESGLLAGEGVEGLGRQRGRTFPGQADLCLPPSSPNM